MSLNWETVENTVSERLFEDSLLHTLKSVKKMKKRTKLFNKKLKKYRVIKSYTHYLKLRRQVKRECNDGEATEDEAVLSHDDYKRIHDAKPKTELQLFLRLCRLKNKRKSKQKTNGKEPKIAHKKSDKSSIVSSNSKLLSKSNNPLTDLEPLPLTSSTKKRRSSRTKSSQTERTVHSQSTQTPGQSNIRKVYDEGEKIAAEKIDLTDRSDPNESVDSSLDSNSEMVELSGIEDVEAVNLLEEKLDARGREINVRSASHDRTELDDGLKAFTDDEEDDSNVSADVRDDSNAASPILSSTDIVNGDCLQSQENMFMTNDDKLDFEQSLNNDIDGDKFTGALNDDSGNNSLLNADVFGFTEGNGNSTAINEATKSDDDISEEIVMLPDDLSELEMSIIKLNGLAKNVRVDKKLNISWLDLQHKTSVAKDIVSDGSLDSDASQEIALAKPISNSQTGGEPLILNTATNNGSKVKIRTIERYEKGHEIFSTYRLPDQKKVVAVNNNIDKTSKNELPLNIEDLSRSRKSSENYNLFEAKSNHSNDLLDNKDSSSFKSNRKDHDTSMDIKLILEVKEELEGDKSSEKYDSPLDSPEGRSQRRNLSLNSSFSSFSVRSYDEDVKNSVKAKLLLEIEQRLEDPASKKLRTENNKSHNRNLFSSDEEDIAELINDQLLIEETEFLNDKGSTRKSHSLQIQPQTSSRSASIKNVSKPCQSTPAKRRMSSSTTTDPNMLDTTPHSRKQPRLQKQKIRDLGWFPCEPQFSEAISHELQQPEKIDNSVARHTTKERPKSVKEFVSNDELAPDTMKSYFRLKDIDEDEEIWIMDVPRTINAEDLKDRVILLGGKSEVTFGDTRYEVSSKASNRISNVSCVLTKSRRRKEYEIVNIESKGRIKFHQKLSVVPATELTASNGSAVPFPKNLKTRHPIFGASYEDKI